MSHPMTDTRAKLEAAAGACGKTIEDCTCGGVALNGLCWNPLEDDGDAFRLLTDLHLNLGVWFGVHGVHREAAVVETDTHLFMAKLSDHNNNRRAATRAAIVDAAAAAGGYGG